MTEAELQRNIIDLAKMSGWLCHAERAAMTKRGDWLTPIQGHAGYVDLTMVHPERGLLIFAELKAHGQKPRPEQYRWLDAIANVYSDPDARIRTFVWRPEDLEQIIDILTGHKEARRVSRT